jgi:steroid delta-isomerase-like uncharacterized protein
MNLTKFTAFLLIMFVTMQNAFGQDTEGNKKVARFYFEEICNKQKPELLSQVFADSFLVHNLADSTQNWQTITGQTAFVKSMFKAFPDIEFKVGDIIGEGDKVVLRTSFAATHKDEFWGYKASGNRIKYISEVFFYRFKNGKVVEIWFQFDRHSLIEQIKTEK